MLLIYSNIVLSETQAFLEVFDYLSICDIIIDAKGAFMNTQILVADDEKDVADLLEMILTNDGLIVHKFYESPAALSFLEEHEVDLAILDIMMPDLDGFTLCRRIREKYLFPIIMLTAKVEDTDKISGLMQGADDYITKPFNPLEVLARVKTQLRRYKKYNPSNPGGSSPADETTAEVCDIRGLYINRTTHECRLYDRPLELTPTEFDILWVLCTHQGQVVSSEELFRHIWGEKYYEGNNTVMNHVGKLREKLKESYRHPKFIKTVWGIGYTIEK